MNERQTVRQSDRRRERESRSVCRRRLQEETDIERERESRGGAYRAQHRFEMLTWCRAWRRRMMVMRSVASVRECVVRLVAVAGCNGALD